MNLQNLVFQSQGNEMLSGDKAGLVSTDTLRKEKEDRRKRERAAEHLAGIDAA